MSTLMAGLACGEPNITSWPMLRPCHLFYFRRRLSGGQRHAPVGRSATSTDEPFVSGNSAIGTGVLYALMTQPAYRELAESLRLNADAQVLLISTEGDTSPDVYEDIVWFGRNG
ncbi:hypothetical protein J4734_20920 [Klebsiella pneumoniae]|uniref:Diaminopropionate ammonia-lyase n=1 Tax=Klebsiella pneumoniae TaxID=573 RepID=A0A939NRG3_KLEPN|nr:hypothetical protein [Klebsiella pneumoniae]